MVWAVPIAAASASAYGFYRIQRSEFTVIDVMSFWAAKHEFGRAGEFYQTSIVAAALLGVMSVLAVAMPPAPMKPGLGILLRRLSWLPCLPIVLIAGIVIFRQGQGAYSLPKQFSPLSLVAVAALKAHSGVKVERLPVRITPGAPLSRAIVFVVDESVRADHVSLRPGNPFTPKLAEQRDRWIDFGPAVSGGNCSNISNALLRFMADPRRVKESVRTNPTIWQYAKAAGYRTVYVDAQAGFIKEYGKLQNYMTAAETIHIDRLHKLDESIPAHTLDDRLMDIVRAELHTQDKVFIYANKSGAHFPYQDNVPENHRDVTQMHANDPAIKEKSLSYLAAIRWTVDRVMSAFVAQTHLPDATIIYTSDHGQHFADDHLTHCSSGESVKPDEAMVPLMVLTEQADLAERFRKVANRQRSTATHFAIPPTVLELMGYAPSDIRARYESSLLDTLRGDPAFVSGDIFGIFSDEVSWHSITGDDMPVRARDNVSSSNRSEPPRSPRETF